MHCKRGDITALRSYCKLVVSGSIRSSLLSTAICMSRQICTLPSFLGITTGFDTHGVRPSILSLRCFVVEDWLALSTFLRRQNGIRFAFCATGDMAGSM